MKTRTLTGDWLAAQREPVRGVFLTHLHLDHVLGMRDFPPSTSVMVGAGDAKARSFENLFMSGVYDDALTGKGPLQELTFRPDASGLFAGVLDVFGDGTFWAISVPGHTVGSAAFVARTPSGPVLPVATASSRRGTTTSASRRRADARGTPRGARCALPARGGRTGRTSGR